MGKHESPALRMRVEKGRLVPAAAWDQERLASYQNGSLVNVHVTQQKNRKLERKYWAILHDVVERCPVKQRTAEDLHKALRLRLGVVDAFFTMDGKLKVDLKSTSGMEEPEYRAYFDDAMAELEKATGVDPLTLYNESADVGEDEPSSPAVPPVDDAGSGDLSPPVPAAEPSASSHAADPAGGTSGDEPEQPSADLRLSDEDRAWLKVTTRMLWAATAVGEQDLLAATFKGARENHTPPGISKAARDRGNSIYLKCKLVCFGEKDAGETLEAIALVACVEPREIVS